MANKTTECANSVFEQPWWLDVVAPGSWKEILAEEDGKLVARWPIVLNGNRIGMPELTPTLGFWLSEKILHSDPYYNERKSLTNLLLEQFPKSKTISIRLDPTVRYFLPFYWKHFIVTPCISYRINNLENLDGVYQRFNKNVKRHIERASKKLKVNTIDDIELLFKLIDQTFKIQKRGNPFPKDLIRKIYNISQEYNSSKLLYAIDERGNVHSGALFVYDRNVCYYWRAGSDPAFRSSGANSLLIWEGIKFASTVSRSFDFEGSMVEGIENFFRQFGGTPTVYYQIRKQIIVREIYELVKPKLKALIGYKQ